MTKISYFIVWVSLSSWAIISSAEDCPDEYRRFSAEHTYCLPPNEGCQIFDQHVSEEDKELIVRVHNELRSKIAMGEETIGNLPSAADMLQMEWDDELAIVAQRHSDQCVMEHEADATMREVRNFMVGQNLYQSGVGDDTPSPNWESAIRSWYKEVENFDASIIKSFGSDKGTGVIGHFTQVIWAKSWRVGCGYTYNEYQGEKSQLYTCNYGPAGNMKRGIIYEEGNPSSMCPGNTCSGSDCERQPVYNGLCQVTSGKHPVYSPPSDYTYFCNFEEDCGVSTPDGMKTWLIYDTLSGSYAGIILEGGESSALNFSHVFEAVPVICISIAYRKGPNIAGEMSNNEAQRIFYSVSSNQETPTDMKRDTEKFMPFGMTLSFDEELTFSVTFSVPEGAPAQYLEITDIFSTEGKCNRKKHDE